MEALTQEILTRGDDSPTIFFFGSPWRALLDHPHRLIPTPIDKPCLHCEELIHVGDRGVLIAVVTRLGPAPESMISNVHLECDIRSKLGGMSHMEKRCLCFKGKEGADHTFDGTFREEAIAVLAFLNKEWTDAGHEPMW